MEYKEYIGRLFYDELEDRIRLFMIMGDTRYAACSGFLIYSFETDYTYKTPCREFLSAIARGAQIHWAEELLKTEDCDAQSEKS